MTTFALPQVTENTESPVASAVREGLNTRPKRLPAWLFYDADGSNLFDQITRLPEYYLTGTERQILSDHAEEILAQAMGPETTRLHIAELGAGSADKTRLLLKAAVDRQQTLIYEPVDVSASALEAARERIEREIPGVEVCPRVLNYTQGLDLEPAAAGERRLVLYIGSSIGNFEPVEGVNVLKGVRAGLDPGDTLLLGVDLRKPEATLLAAYDDKLGITARFNLNMLARLNRELGAGFDLGSFAHRALWNPIDSRIEMHLVSLIPQSVTIPALDLEVAFNAGETIHTENSYKYSPGQPEDLLYASGFLPETTWFDPREWFAVCLARAQ
ncbi:MAG TPA: L-histidine N(alpha)-methyltransferase [Terracidiphilus sp.]|jgi:L-histidine Nalpha-methyltransferase